MHLHKTIANSFRFVVWFSLIIRPLLSLATNVETVGRKGTRGRGKKRRRERRKGSESEVQEESNTHWEQGLVDYSAPDCASTPRGFGARARLRGFQTERTSNRAHRNSASSEIHFNYVSNFGLIGISNLSLHLEAPSLYVLFFLQVKNHQLFQTFSSSLFRSHICR